MKEETKEKATSAMTWMVKSNHILHILVCLVLAVIGALLTHITGVHMVAAITAGAYGAATAGLAAEYKDWVNSKEPTKVKVANACGDLLADAIGIGIGLAIYSLLAV